MNTNEITMRQFFEAVVNGNITPAMVEKAKAEIGDKAKSEEDVLSYIAFPQYAEAYFDKRDEKIRNTFKYTIREV